MTLNHDLVRTRCQEISDSVERLEKVGRESRENFLKDNDLQDIACYRLLVAIEAALGLCYHVAAKEMKKVPEEYAQCFMLLAEAGFIPVSLSENLQKMARFRNLLVHMYWKVDYNAVYDIIRMNLADLLGFSRFIAKLI